MFTGHFLWRDKMLCVIRLARCFHQRDPFQVKLHILFIFAWKEKSNWKKGSINVVTYQVEQRHQSIIFTVSPWYTVLSPSSIVFKRKFHFLPELQLLIRSVLGKPQFLSSYLPWVWVIQCGNLSEPKMHLTYPLVKAQPVDNSYYYCQDYQSD